jgi:Nitronate monooxygenase
MAGLGTVELVAAVCEAGGLGSIGCATMQPHLAAQTTAELRSSTEKPVNANFFCHRPATLDGAREQAWRDRLSPYCRELGIEPEPPRRLDVPPFGDAMCEIVEETRPEMVSFHFGLPAAGLGARVKAAGCRVTSSATTVEEALWLEAHDVDAVIAQGPRPAAIVRFSSRAISTARWRLKPVRWRSFRKLQMSSACPSLPPVASPMDAILQPPSRSAPQACRLEPPFCSVPRPGRQPCIATRYGMCVTRRSWSRTYSPNGRRALSPTAWRGSLVCCRTRHRISRSRWARWRRCVPRRNGNRAAISLCSGRDGGCACKGDVCQRAGHGAGAGGNRTVQPPRTQQAD